MGRISNAITFFYTSFNYYINPIYLSKKVDRFWDVEAQRAGVTLNTLFFKQKDSIIVC